MPLLTATEYARHRKVYPRAVMAAIEAGRILRDERGLIDSEQADRDWESGSCPYRSAAAKANGAAGQELRRKLNGKAEEAFPSPEVAAPLTDISTYARSRARTESIKAEMAQLTLDERKGKLIDRGRVDSAARAFYARVAQEILGVPDRLAAELAAVSEATAAATLLREELTRILSGFDPEASCGA